MVDNLFENISESRALKALFYFSFIIVTLWNLGPTSGVPAIQWMDIYRVSDFKNLHDVSEFLASLQSAIPPAIALSEILDHWLTGTSLFVDGLLYRVSMVFCFVLAVNFTARNNISLLLLFVISYVMISCIGIIHIGNAQVYDVYFPYFILLSFLFICKTSDSKNHAAAWLFGFLSGFVLSMAELTRPFFIYVLPVIFLSLLLSGLFSDRRKFISIVAPLILISGAWHGYIAIAHGTFVWSNEVGFNLRRAWPTEPVQLIPEPAIGQTDGTRLANIDTIEHTINSRRITHAVIGYAYHHPWETFKNVIHRVLAFLEVPTDIYSYHPVGKVLRFYRPLVWLSILSSVTTVWRILISKKVPLPRKGAAIAFHTAVVGLGSGLIMALGERGEEARFLISILPLVIVSMFAYLDAFIGRLYYTDGL